MTSEPPIPLQNWLMPLVACFVGFHLSRENFNLTPTTLACLTILRQQRLIQFIGDLREFGL